MAAELAALDRYLFWADAAACPGYFANRRPIQLKVARWVR
jgi:hypothetical protein